MTDLTKLKTPFGMLDPETQDALRKWGHGWEIFTDQWYEYDGHHWSPRYTYRARPAPLVPDSINWDHVAPGWKWMARSERNTAWLFRRKPVLDPDFWNEGTMTTKRADCFASYRRGTVAWQDSLVERPA